jgi:hypothetical protein
MAPTVFAHESPTHSAGFDAVICDEIAFWIADETSRNPDKEILDAIRHSWVLIASGQITIVRSTVGRPSPRSHPTRSLTLPQIG